MPDLGETLFGLPYLALPFNKELAFDGQCAKLFFMSDIIQKAKEYFLKTIDEAPVDRWQLKIHVPEAEKWANIVLKKYPEADREVVILSVWLHDVAHYEGDWNIDHAVKGEKKTREFLTKINYPKDKIEQVCHCVRSHRSRDVMPESIDAKLVALIDSLSHLTYAPYIDATRDGRTEEAIEKLERDWNDICRFPEFEAELQDVYDGWKLLLTGLLNSSYSQK